MNRRTFIQLASAALIAPQAITAQQSPFAILTLEIQNYINAQTPEWNRRRLRRQQILDQLHRTALKYAEMAEKLI